MADEQKARLSRILQTIVPIAGVTVALLSFFLGYVSRKKQLTSVYLGAEKLVSVSNAVAPDVSVQYHGEKVYSLSKMNFVIRNSGAAAIKGGDATAGRGDVVEPVQLEFPTEVKILSTSVERTLPSEFSFTTKPSGNYVDLGFPLLNPGDEAYFAVYIYNSEPRTPRLRGRIVDVQLSQTAEVRDAQGRALPFISNPSTRTGVFWTLLVVNAIIAVALFGFWIYLTKEYIVFRTWMGRYKERTRAAIEELTDKNSYEYKYLKEGLDKGNNMLMNAESKAILKEKGIPEPPWTEVNAVGEAASWTLALLGLTASFVFTCLYLYTAPR
jgi:hypothetical protein